MAMPERKDDPVINSDGSVREDTLWISTQQKRFCFFASSFRYS